MEELLKMLLEAEKHGAKVEVHKMDKDDLGKILDQHDKNKDTKEVDDASHIAHINRILYEAHIKEGFTAEEALALTVAVIQ